VLNLHSRKLHSLSSEVGTERSGRLAMEVSSGVRSTRVVC